MKTLGHLRGHSHHIPYFIQLISECKTSITKIQKFLRCEEMETHMIEHSQEDHSDHAVRIDKANFFWGLDE